MEALIHGNNARRLTQTRPIQSWKPADTARLARHYLIACLAVIMSISIYDAYLVVAYKSLILEFEQNPICLVLIELDPSSLIYFLLGKTLGTLCVVGSLIALYLNRKKHWWVVSTSVTAFQIGLLGFLTLR